MIRVSHVSNGPGVMAHIRVEGWDRLRRCVLFFWQATQTSLHLRTNPPPYKTPAPRGNPPAIRTGFLAGNVVYELDEANLTGRVGVLSNAIYGMFLELRGWSWLKFTLDKTLPQLRAIAKGND